MEGISYRHTPSAVSESNPTVRCNHLHIVANLRTILRLRHCALAVLLAASERRGRIVMKKRHTSRKHRRSQERLLIGRSFRPLELATWAQLYRSRKKVHHGGITFREADIRTIWEICSYRQKTGTVAELVLGHVVDWFSDRFCYRGPPALPWVPEFAIVGFSREPEDCRASLVREMNRKVPGLIFKHPAATDALVHFTRVAVFSQDTRQKASALKWLRTALALPAPRHHTRLALNWCHQWVYREAYRSFTSLKQIMKRHRVTPIEVLPELGDLTPRHRDLILRLAREEIPLKAAADYVADLTRDEYGPAYRGDTIRKRFAVDEWSMRQPHLQETAEEHADLRLRLAGHQ
jgi:hypothetical protein